MAIKDVGRLAWASAILLSLSSGCATEIQEGGEALAQLGDAGSGGSIGGSAGGTDPSAAAAGTSMAVAGTGGALETGGVANGGGAGTSQGGVAGSAGASAMSGSGGAGGSAGAAGSAGAGAGGMGGAGGKASAGGMGGVGGSAGAAGKAGMGGMAGAGGGSVQAPCKNVKLAIKGATASSIEDATLPASQAFDGDMATRWASAKSEPQWIYFDLGEVAHVSRVVINWEAAFATNYRLEIAQASAGPWTSIFQESAGDGGTDDVTTLTAKNGRYVRMYGNTRATVYGFSIYEFAIYGDLDETCK